MKILIKQFGLLLSMVSLLGIAPAAFAQDAAEPAADAAAAPAAAPAEAAPAAAPAEAAPVAPAEEDWDDKWKISVNSKSAASGTISFKVIFEPGKDGAALAPITVTAPIPEKTSENKLADMIATAFKGILGEEKFKIDVDWGEHVKVHAKGDTPDFVVKIESNNVEGLGITITKD